MIESIAAAGQQTPVHMNLNEAEHIAAAADVERFDAVYEAQAPMQLEPDYTLLTDQASETSIQPATAGEKILDTIARLDSSFEGLFPKDLLESLETSGGGDVTPSTGAEESFKSMINDYREMMAHSMKVSLWSTEVGLVSASVSKSAQGVQTLFRSSG